MGMNYLFPSYELAQEELKRDLYFKRIPEEDKEKIVRQAWEKGYSVANAMIDKCGGNIDFFELGKQCGLTIQLQDKDYVSGNMRYFSDYIAGTGEVNLYNKSIEMWCEKNEVTLDVSQKMFLAHEFFHFLEWNYLGLLSKTYTVPIITIGKIKIGMSGIRALSEIGAHGFVRTIYDREGMEESDAGAISI